MNQSWKFITSTRNQLLFLPTRFNYHTTQNHLEKMEETLLKKVRSVIPKLSGNRHKGAAGRIGVIGGSIEYTGAPYFSAIAALKAGADLAHVFCQKAAAPVIKSYSPELIVHPLLDDDNAVNLITPWLPRLHVLIIGPGLGREESIFNTVTSIINHCREQQESIPLVIDADGLFLITERPKLVQGYPGSVVLTPNAMEFSRLWKSVLPELKDPNPNTNANDVEKLSAAMGTNIVIVRKGAEDMIATGKESFSCSATGSGRRCGGQGDLLCGSLGSFLAWAEQSKRECGDLAPGVIAGYAACRLTRECNSRAFQKTGRSTLTSDMIEEIHGAFEALYETS